MLAVIIILGIISSIVVMRVFNIIDTSKKNTCFENKANINQTIDRYYVEKGIWPTTVSDLETSEYFDQGVGTCPVNGNTYLISPTTHQIIGHTHTGGGGGGY